MSKQKSRAQLETELKLIKQSRLSDGVIRIVRDLIKYGALVCIAYYAFRSVETLSGKTTLADIGINFLANVKVSVIFAWLFGFVGIAYGYFQRNLRKETVARLQPRVQELEQHVDKNRSSSKITKQGNTRPEDK